MSSEKRRVCGSGREELIGRRERSSAEAGLREPHWRLHIELRLRGVRELAQHEGMLGGLTGLVYRDIVIVVIFVGEDRASAVDDIAKLGKYRIGGQHTGR